GPLQVAAVGAQAIAPSPAIAAGGLGIGRVEDGDGRAQPRHGGLCHAVGGARRLADGGRGGIERSHGGIAGGGAERLLCRSWLEDNEGEGQHAAREEPTHGWILRLWGAFWD